MEKPKMYSFPAVFEHTEDGIGIYFPDLPGAISGAETEVEALQCAKEVLGLHLLGMEEDEDIIPEPSSLFDIELESNERAVLVEVYMPSIRFANVNKSVNRTVTLPAWLNAKGMELQLNFSQLLQEAIKAELQLN